jgi:hypothetical protein
MVDAVSTAMFAIGGEATPSRNGGHPPASSAIVSNTAQAATSPGTPDPGPAQPAREMQLEITRNDAIGAFIYTLIDKKSGEIVRQWPTEQMVKMREYFAERGLQMLDKTI